MKNRNIQGVVVLIFVCLLASTPVMAKNSQTLVIGAGLGAYNFGDEDLSQISNLLYGSEFLEWYLFDEIGIGIRSHKFYKTDSSESNEEFLMANLNLTATWVFLGSADDFRMAAYVGYGPGGVSYTNQAENIDVTTTASTSSAGLFLDWGGEMWGVRVGMHLVSARFDYKEGDDSGTLDGSGNSYDIGIRLAF
jgi:hypothetical protein